MNCEFSPCKKYRYTLWREWDLPRGLPYGLNGPDGLTPLPLHASSEYVMFIGLNPSTADDTQDDPTIRRCRNFAKAWGFGRMVMTNLFAYRATLPDDMKSQADPVGQDNDLWIKQIAAGAGLVVAAWGKHGVHLDRARRVMQMIPKLHVLLTNADGSPRHPLYVPGNTKPRLI